jgi:hypothetical protein
MSRGWIVRTTAALFGVLLLLADPALAQRRGRGDGRGEERGEERIGKGWFGVGAQALDLDELNASLVAHGYPNLSDGFVTLALGGWGSHGPVVLGLEGAGYIEDEEDILNGARRAALTGGYGLFRFGYSVRAMDDIDVVPLIGIGGGAMRLALTEHSAPTFDEVLDDPGRSSQLTTGMFLLDASLAVHYRFTDRGDGRGFLVGLQGGYLWAPTDASWKLEDANDVAGGPELRVQGPYVRLQLGGWKRERR